VASRVRTAVLLVVFLTLLGVVTPPVIEDHFEPGFCSAACPVQHAGHGADITPSTSAGAPRRAPALAAAIPRARHAHRVAFTPPDAPRAPPSA
jgi:hypothetical protein